MPGESLVLAGARLDGDHCDCRDLEGFSSAVPRLPWRGAYAFTVLRTTALRSHRFWVLTDYRLYATCGPVSSKMS